MKQLKKTKLNNEGLSLVEILVTVVIVALISAPIVDSFLHAIHVNSEARLIQNGTAVAQDTAEFFEVFDIQMLVDVYTDKGAKVTYDDAKGVYTFVDIPMTGADGEEFELDVKLDPTAYKLELDAENNEKIKVNDVSLPKFSSLYNSDSVMLYRQYAGPDETLKTLFAGKITDPDTLENIYTDSVKKDITKETQIMITCTAVPTADAEKVNYTYTINVKNIYTYLDASGVKIADAEKVLEKTYSSDEIAKIYLLCPIFDRYTIDSIGSINGDRSYSSDKIKIDYYFVGDSKYWTENLYFYIAEQKMVNKNETSKQQSISPKNVTIRCYSNNDVINDSVPDYVDYIEYVKKDEKLKVYSNIGQGFQDFINNQGLTYGDYGTGTSLYEMEIKVRLKGEDDVVTTFKTAK